MKLRACKFYFVGIFLISSGCTVKYLAKESLVDSTRIPRFKVAGEVKLTNAQGSSDDVLVPKGNITLSINYREHTQLILNLLKKELDERSSTLFGDAPKEIKLAVVDVKMIPTQLMTRCIMNSTIETKEGYIRGIEVIGASWNFFIAIDTAVANTVIAVLNDEQILAYLEK